MKQKKTRKPSSFKKQISFRSLFPVILFIALLLFVGKVITQIPTNPSPASEKTSGYFQTILSKNCKEVQDNTWYGYEINNSKVPVKIDENVLTLSYQNPNTSICYVIENQPQSFFSFTLNDKSSVFVYDKNSVEMGHGGLPYIGSLPIIVKDDGEIKFSIALDGAGAGPSFVGYVPLILRGEKTLQLSNGEIVYVKYDSVILEGNNPTLVAFLSKYSQPYDGDPTATAKELTDIPDRELKSTFFGDLSKLGPEEKTAMEKITKVLQAINPK